MPAMTREEINAALRPHGLTPSQRWIFELIAAADAAGGLALGELIRVTRFARPTINRALTRLRRLGLVSKEPGLLRLAETAP